MAAPLPFRSLFIAWVSVGRQTSADSNCCIRWNKNTKNALQVNFAPLRQTEKLFVPVFTPTNKKYTRARTHTHTHTPNCYFWMCAIHTPNYTQTFMLTYSQLSNWERERERGRQRERDGERHIDWDWCFSFWGGWEPDQLVISHKVCVHACVCVCVCVCAWEREKERES